MQNAVELFSRELLFLLVAAAFGCGLVRLLDERIDRAARVALAPVLGLCVAVCFYTTMNWFYSGTQLAWTIPVLAVVSLGSVGVPTFVRAIRGTARPDRRSRRALSVDALQIVVVLFAVGLPASTALLRNDSVGPTTYAVFDAVGYVATSDAAQLMSIHQEIHTRLPAPNLIENYAVGYSYGYQQLDLAPFTGTLDALVDLHATDTQSAFLIAVMEIAGLGMFAAIRTALRRPTWFAVLGGGLFAGGFFLQLFFDGSQGALAGMAIMVPLIVMLGCAITRPRGANLALGALLIAGMMTCYPIFVVPLAITAALATFVWLLRGIVQRKAVFARDMGVWVLRAISVFVAAGLLDLVATRRDGHYWHSLLHGGFVEPDFPQYHLGVGVVASWLLQTRGLYTAAFGPQSAFYDIVPALLVPLVVVIAVIPIIRRNRVLWIFVLMVAVVSLLGTYEGAHNMCGYCEDRNLISAEPALIFVIVVSLAGLCASKRPQVRWASLGVLALLLSFVGYSFANEWTRFDDGAYFVTSADRSVISALPPTELDVDVEGFGEGTSAPGEEPLIYEMIFDRTDGRVSIAADVDDREGLAYFGTQPLSGPWFHPDYGYVFTRLPGIATTRQVVAEVPGVGLERREGPLDVLVDSGLGVQQRPSEDPSGDGWIIGSLRLIVTGALDRPVYIRLDLMMPSSSDRVPPTDGALIKQKGDQISLCVSVAGGDKSRVTTLSIPTNPTARLASIKASYQGCR